jgi:fused signal recognition particle receptor
MADGQTPHYCSACGEIHGGPHGQDPSVKIAQIEADKEIRVAEIMSKRVPAPPEELEVQTEIAQIEADSAVDVAEAIGPITPAPVEPEPVEPDPMPVEDVIEPEGEPEPPEVTADPTPRQPKKKSWWGAYS